MKKLFQFFLALLFTVITWASGIAGNPGFKVISVDQASLGLFMEDLAGNAVKVTLFDLQGVVLHRETIRNKSSLSRKYNLRNLPDGEYTLLAQYQNEVRIQPVQITAKQLLIPEGKSIKLFTPRINKSEDHLDLNLLSLPASDITVKIRNAEGKAWFSDAQTAEGSLHKRYNIEALETGDYQIVVAIDERNINLQFSEPFSVK